MTMFTDDLGCHVARRATNIPRVILFDASCDPQISKSAVTIGFKDDVFGFYVAVEDATHVEVVQGFDYAGYDEADRSLVEFYLIVFVAAGDVVAQIASGHQLH